MSEVYTLTCTILINNNAKNKVKWEDEVGQGKVGITMKLFSQTVWQQVYISAHKRGRGEVILP